VHDCVIAGTAFTPRSRKLKDDWHGHLTTAAPQGARGLELVFEQYPAVYDGRFANNGWLQELPPRAPPPGRWLQEPPSRPVPPRPVPSRPVPSRPVPSRPAARAVAASSSGGPSSTSTPPAS